ncbi:pleckstrin homology domain-containing family G member 5-like [Galendromus occidentalis]|uniref:Pleckstrin homology domain-containing family G member 5-like n=1 Tax=Galendromus occidentalis TaxID=34638 RepID=A0AAJ7SII5_9ACAR|nr:pleckstrin homology domain-containing family G member 5-like [Galendromus occidentalis]
MSNINTTRSFSGRTKSLREKFASKRSYSEIFKPDVVKEAANKARGNSRPRCSLQVAPPPTIAPSSSPYMSPGSGGPSTGNTTPSGSAGHSSGGLISSYALSETTYGSALDINSERENPRFPWQRDAAVQCCLDNEDATDNHLSIRIPSQTGSCTSSIDASSGCFSFESMQRLLDLSISSSSQQQPPNKSSLYLGIPNTSGGRDGKLGVNSFQLNLPSPNVHPEAHDQERMFRRLSGKSEASEEEEEVVQDEPPASALHRRRALVPPKLICPDGYEDASHSDEVPIERRRSSSGPVEVCGAADSSSPSGDLLVYSKVLTQRNNILTQAQQEVDGSTQSLMAVASEESGRKGRNSWSLLRIFDRNHRGKSDSITGLEEVLNQLRPSDVDDEQLCKYKGLQWSDFVALQTSPSTAETGDTSEPSSPRTIPDTVTVARGIYSMDGARKKEAIWDLFQTECMFLYDHLMVLRNVFMEPLKKIQVEGFAMFAEPEVLFGNLDELCCVTYAFCKEFIQLLSSDSMSTSDLLLKLFTKSCKITSMRQAYHRYTLNYINALNYLETLRRQIEFVEFEKWCYKDPRCKKLQLPDLLVSPVQHVMRIPLVLRKILSRSDESQEKAAIESILEAEEASLRELDDKMKWLKNFERLLEIQRNIVWPSVTELDPKAFVPEFLKTPLSRQPCEKLIVSPKRQIVLEGVLTLMESGRPSECYLILFDDMILITRRKRPLNKKKSTITENWVTCGSPPTTGSGIDMQEGTSTGTGTVITGSKYIVYKQPLSLDRVCIHDVSTQDATANNLRHAFVFVCLNRFQQVVNVHTFQTQNESSKLLWLGRLQDTVDHWKRTLQSTVFRHRPSTAPSDCVSISGQQSPRRST